MVFLWFSYGFPMVFHRFPNQLVMVSETQNFSPKSTEKFHLLPTASAWNSFLGNPKNLHLAMAQN